MEKCYGMFFDDNGRVWCRCEFVCLCQQRVCTNELGTPSSGNENGRRRQGMWPSRRLWRNWSDGYS